MILENVNLFNNEEISLIQEETNLKMLDGMKIKSHFLPIVLKKIYILLNESLKGKEVLIFGDDEKLMKEFILSLTKEVKFITLVGDSRETIEDISKFVLEKTGLSIFHSKNIDKILKNYSIIINLKDNIKINENKIRKEAVIFDFSLGKGLSRGLEGTNTSVVIEDFMFKAEALDMQKNNWIEERVSSSIYEYFNKVETKDLHGLLVKGKVYSIEDFTYGKIRHSRSL